MIYLPMLHSHFSLIHTMFFAMLQVGNLHCWYSSTESIDENMEVVLWNIFYCATPYLKCYPPHKQWNSSLDVINFVKAKCEHLHTKIQFWQKIVLKSSLLPPPTHSPSCEEHCKWYVVLNHHNFHVSDISHNHSQGIWD